jgi:P3 major capsid protein
MAQQQQGGQMSPAQINAIARAAIKAKAIKMTQQIFSQTYGSFANTNNISTVQPVVNIIPRNVGLITGFWIKVSAGINNQAGAGDTANVTDFGPANVLTQIQFNDLNNNTRIQTTGWHINFVDSMKARQPFGSTLLNGTGIAGTGPTYGNNFAVAGTIQAPSTIAFQAAQGASTIVMWYYVPLAYSNDDLRGAVYANVVNATMQLNPTFNTTPCVLNTADFTSAIYTVTAGTPSAVVISVATVTVYQEYLDQLPMGQGGVLLPILDLATIYELKNTVVTAITPGQDFPVQYANFRDFLSTTCVYVNTASSGARVGGTDVNYFALQSANFTNIWKKDPGLIAIQTRNHLQADLPAGCYYFSSREKPISTVQYGNMQLVLNPITANAGAYMLMGYEDFALVQTLNMAGSLAAS